MSMNVIEFTEVAHILRRRNVFVYSHSSGNQGTSMNISTEDRRLDRKGRITIPKSIREQLNLTPGDHVDIDVEDDAVVIRSQISRKEFVEQMKGCINKKTRSADSSSFQPEDLKADWISDLPSDS